MEDFSSIGIDLGTSTSLVGSFNEITGTVDVFANKIGQRITPSLVSFSKEVLVGEEALDNLILLPQNTVYGIKRLIGRYFEDINYEEEIKNLPFKVVNRKRRPYVEIKNGGKTKYFSPEEISAYILKHLHNIASRNLGHETKNVVITVPAHFTENQRNATIEAGKLAELNILDIVNEPTAAAVAFGFSQKVKKVKVILVFDLGGGTFDVSLLTVNKGKINVTMNDGISHLGGEDFDLEIVKILRDKFMAKHKTAMDPLTHPRSRSMLKIEAEKAKRNLSFNKEVTVSIPGLIDGLDLECKITRTEFEASCSKYFDMCLNIIEQIFVGDITKDCVTDVLLVGGSSRIPYVKQMLHEYFGIKPIENISPDEAVVIGAAHLAYMKAQNLKKEAEKVTKADEKEDKKIKIETEEKKVEQIGGVVVVIKERASHTIGFPSCGKMQPIIKRGTILPADSTPVLVRPEYDNAKEVIIKIYEGESEDVLKNELIGSCIISGLPAKKATENFFDLRFTVNTNGTISVSATIEGTTQTKYVELKREGLTRRESEEAASRIYDYVAYDNAKMRLSALGDKVQITKRKQYRAKDRKDQSLFDRVNVWMDEISKGGMTLEQIMELENQGNILLNELNA